MYIYRERGYGVSRSIKSFMLHVCISNLKVQIVDSTH
jgi:hypothetical protein